MSTILKSWELNYFRPTDSDRKANKFTFFFYKGWIQNVQSYEMHMQSCSFTLYNLVTIIIVVFFSPH